MCYQVINNGLEGPDHEALLREEGKGRGYHKPRGGNLIILGDSHGFIHAPITIIEYVHR